MFSNWETSVRRPSVLTAIWKAPSEAAGGLVDGAGRHLDVRGPQGRDHVRGGQVARGGLGRVEPDAHGEIARAEDLDVAHAIDAAQHVLHVQGDVVRQILRVPRAVRGDDVDDHHHVRRRLARLDAVGADLRRQARLGGGDAVLDQHLRLIDIDARLEDHIDGQASVAG